MKQLHEQLVEEIRDLYDAEKQLVKALPKMAKAVTTEELNKAFLDHAETTRNQVLRLEQVFELLGERAKSKPCKAMKGLVEEASEHLKEHSRGQLLDNILITASQKVEHYEIAGYGTVRSIAKTLGHKEIVSLLEQTKKEEEACDKLLTKISLRLQKELLNGDSKSKTGAGSQITTDHDVIRKWAEDRGAHPAGVRGTGRKGGSGILRLDFPGYSGGDTLREISWDQFFQKFDAEGLALLYQEKTASGKRSNFNKLISAPKGKKQDTKRK